jgi:hypothetical protein
MARRERDWFAIVAVVVQIAVIVAAGAALYFVMR